MSRRRGQLAQVTVARRSAVIEALLTGPKTTSEVVLSMDASAQSGRSRIWHAVCADLRVMEQRGMVERERPILNQKRKSVWRIVETAH